MPAVDLCLPVSHKAHVDSPGVVVYFPASHSVQLAKPGTPPFLPAVQSWHTSCPVASFALPSGHSLQLDSALPPNASRCLPEGQSLHKTWAWLSMYLPLPVLDWSFG